MGCDFLDDPSLQQLSNIEQRYEQSSLVSDWLGEGREGVIVNWMVGELSAGNTRRRRRQTYQEYQPIYPSRTAGAVEEASGIYSIDDRGPQIARQMGQNEPFDPIHINVQQIAHFRVPPTTFPSNAGVRPELRLFEHVYPIQFGVDFKDPSTLTGHEVENDDTRWISFDPTTEVIRFQPNPEHEGDHKYILCAYETPNKRDCSKRLFGIIIVVLGTYFHKRGVLIVS